MLEGRAHSHTSFYSPREDLIPCDKSGGRKEDQDVSEEANQHLADTMGSLATSTTILDHASCLAVGILSARELGSLG